MLKLACLLCTHWLKAPFPNFPNFPNTKNVTPWEQGPSLLCLLLNKYLLDKLIIDAKKINNVSSDCFLKEIYSYSEWIGYEENTAYIFLLRDSLLPYIYYKSRLCKNI